VIRFTLPIIPTAQARAKIAVRAQGRFAQAYKTQGQQGNERTLEAWLKDYVPTAPLSGPICLDFVAALPVPASASNKKRAAMLAGDEFPAKKPDLDNLAKQLKDAMTRLQFWGDDSQIVVLRCKKIYAASGFWKVAVYRADNPPLMVPGRK
jgi:Holliday junction resolvase RusA-like endonuclease